jgi:hypothetical protein
MKNELIKVLIVVNIMVFLISLAIIYYRYTMITSSKAEFIQQTAEQKVEEMQNISSQNVLSTSTQEKPVQQTESSSSKQQIFSEEKQKIEEEPLDVVKLRKPKFVFFSSKAKKVSLIGDFNDWIEQPMKKTDKNKWEISIEIPEGTYLYNFVVDGKIIVDPNNKKPPKLSKRGYKSSVLELK